MSGIQRVGKNINHVRGDTGIVRVEMETCKGRRLRFRDGDSAVLTIKKKISDAKPVLQKLTTNGYFVFQHEDTQSLPIGNYWYDIQVTLKEGQVITAVGPAQYRLLPDVTSSILDETTDDGESSGPEYTTVINMINIVLSEYPPDDGSYWIRPI